MYQNKQKMNYNEILKLLLKKRGIESEEDVEAFLHPNLTGFYSPFLFKNMEKVCERIQKAIKEREKIVIYGDYDCDGVSAVSVLKLFLEKKGVDVYGFIPSRHHDGYGLTEKSVKFITNTYKPNLVITVDTGISAKNEVELFKSLGVDVIVTDHHEAPEELPDALIIDPKIPSETYPFSGLSGAGVVLKLVQALSSVEESLEYIDIVAISTIGDIVPLLSENRLITVLGLEKINGTSPRPSIAYLKNKLGLKTFNSTDIAFKVVPRINACGRMTSAEKCFHFLCAKSYQQLEKLYKEMEEDNNLRLAETNNIYGRINEHLEKLDLNKTPAIFIVDKEINLGLIGIVASKLVAEVRRPVFVFTEDEQGRLKASIRSVEGINIFNIIDKYRALLVDAGGHSQAGGLTIEKKNYNKFEKLVQEELKNLDLGEGLNNPDLEYDVEITEKDINLKLASLVNSLEPFGFMNPKPVFKLNATSTKVVPLKSYKHFKIGLNGGSEIVTFFGSKYKPLLTNDMDKSILFNLELDFFLKKPRAKAVFKNIYSDNLTFNNEDEFSDAKNLYFSYINKGCKNIAKFYNKESEIQEILNLPAGTLIIADNKKDAEILSKKYNKNINYYPNSDGETIIVYNPRYLLSEADIKLYNNIVFTNGFTQNHNFINKNIFAKRVDNLINFKGTREEFTKVYKELARCDKMLEANELELVYQISEKTLLSSAEVMYGILVSLELGFFELDKTDGVMLTRVKNAEKKELTSSYIFNLTKED